MPSCRPSCRLLPRSLVLLAVAVFAFALPACAETWQQPTPEELKMTADPAAPGADAVYLFREETVQDDIHFHTFYARIKVLTDKGKSFADVELPYQQQNSGFSYNIRNVEGRTIHSDGTVVPFTGKPYDKMVEKSKDFKLMEKVFSMPDVQVGSIVEYRYILEYPDNYYLSPRWYVQQPLYVHKAHYHFKPTGREMTSQDSHGHESVVNHLLYTTVLPKGVAVRSGLDGYDLTIENVPPIKQEDYAPPVESLSYRVVFYYSPYFNADEYWNHEGKMWSKDVDRFTESTPEVKAAAAQIVGPGDTDDQKAQKIYSAVMKLENTRFTRTRSAAENKAEGLRVKTAKDVWQQKRGSDDEITRLYIALARAAGLKAYDMMVTNRASTILEKDYMDWDQLQDEVAIVSIAGKDVFLDPGQRYQTYGNLSWFHANTGGVRQTDQGTSMGYTPPQSYKENTITRFADLTLDEQGNVTGSVRLVYLGDPAMSLRHEALLKDPEAMKKDEENSLETDLPAGVRVTLDHYIGLDTADTVLMATYKVSGTMGTRVGKRVLLPANFFEASAKPLFSSSTRDLPVDLHSSEMVEDQCTLNLPATLTPESVPAAADLKYMPYSLYKAGYQVKDGAYTYGRIMVIGNVLYAPKEYPNLRDYLDKTNAQDQATLVLKLASASAAAASGAGN